jgi:hypothetical protein
MGQRGFNVTRKAVARATLHQTGALAERALDACDVWRCLFSHSAHLRENFSESGIALVEMQKKELEAEMKIKRLADLGHGADGP